MSKHISLDDFLKQQSKGSLPRSGRGETKNPASQPQIDLYNKLCKMKKVEPQDTALFTRSSMSKEIDRLQELPFPASDPQVNAILTLQDEVLELDDSFTPLPEDEIRKLTGGREGSASGVIKFLKDKKIELNDKAKPTDDQLERLASWFPCPVVPFEEYGIYKRAYDEGLTHYCTDVDTPDKLETREWRLVTITNFKKQLVEKLTKKDASYIIGKYRGEVYEWKKTRLSLGQKEHIRKLEARLSDMYVPKPVEMAIIDGIVTEVQKHSDKNEYKSDAYVPLTDFDLDQYSYDEAEKLIDILSYEISLKNEYKSMYGEENVNDEKQIELEKKSAITDENKRLLTEHDALVDETNKFKDLMIALEVNIGYRDDELFEKLDYMVKADSEDEKFKKYKMSYKEYFMAFVTADQETDFEKWEEQIKKLYGMCEESETAMEILVS
jgi:hypothetical protein